MFSYPKAFFVFASVLLFGTLLFTSCTGSRKAGVKGDVRGTWQLISILDRRQAEPVLTKPSDSGRAVELTFIQSFSSQWKVSGHTQTNNIHAAVAFKGKDSLSFSEISSTRVSETPWGQAFLSQLPLVRRYRFLEPFLLELISEGKILLFQKK